MNKYGIDTLSVVILNAYPYPIVTKVVELDESAYNSPEMLDKLKKQIDFFFEKGANLQELFIIEGNVMWSGMGVID